MCFLQLREVEEFYENCSPLPTDDPMVTEHDTCEDYLSSLANFTNMQRRNMNFSDCHCQINFVVTEEIRPSWNFYYGMRNYYQNHRRYLNSWDANQLRGNNLRGTPSSDCRPFVELEDPEEPDEGRRPVVPCGLVANSWFNGMIWGIQWRLGKGSRTVSSLNPAILVLG